MFAGYTQFTAPQTGGVVALDTVTGREQWRTAFPAATNLRVGVGSAGGVVVVNGVVIAAAGDGRIHGLRRVTGAHLWSIPPVGEGAPDVRALAVTGRTLFAGSLTGRVVAYDTSTRRERWRDGDPLDGSIAFEIASDRRNVYVPYLAGRLVALDAATGVERWRTRDDLKGFVWPPAPGAGRLVAAASVAGLFAFHLESR